MVTEQETLIYIEDQDKLDASAAANAFAHKDTKTELILTHSVQNWLLNI